MLRMTLFVGQDSAVSRRVQRSFVGRPSLRERLRCLRMTIFRRALLGCPDEGVRAYAGIRFWRIQFGMFG